MGKKWIAAAGLAALLAISAGATPVSPGTQADPFVSYSYLTDTYYPQTEQALRQRAREGTAQLEQKALDRLKELSEGGASGQGSGSYAPGFTRLTLSRGDRLTLSAGASLLLEAGRTGLAVDTGCLVDVTDGAVLAQGGAPAPGHCYVAAENTSCTLTAVTDAVLLSVQGRYSLASTGVTQTPFTDLAEGDWYYPYARYAYEAGLIRGTTVTVFSPETSASRAMLATILFRQAGVQGGVPSAGFTDVPSGEWYADAVNWAAGSGVVNGIGDGRFAPDMNITREQMAAMLYRYARDYLGMDVSASGDLSVFSDRGQISSWAVEAMSWAVGAGLINGVGDGLVFPGGTATRAQVAAVLQRFSALG